MICFNCCSYGHTKQNCPSKKPICRNCSQNHETENDICNNPAFCKNCSENHSPTSKQCPVYRKEIEIIKLKTENGLSFAEARKRYDQQHTENSYAAVSGVQARLRQIAADTAKDKLILELRNEIAKLKEAAKRNKDQSDSNSEMKDLREEVSKLQAKTNDKNKSKTPAENMEITGKTRLDLPRARSDISPAGAKRTQKGQSSSNGQDSSSEDENKNKKTSAPPRAKRGRPRKNPT